MKTRTRARARADGHLPASAFTRRPRMVRKAEKYYYRTRERKYVGPFCSEESVRFELKIFMLVIQIEKEFPRAKEIARNLMV